MTTCMREGLTELPVKMRDLPLDERGYPIPWFVAWQDGKPVFQAMDGKKFVRAIREKRCWVCGDVMGVYKTFVAGPMCGINRTSAEPPSHLECGRWSARNCPFLNNPRQTRHEMEGVHLEESPGFCLQRNPGVTLLWTTRTYSVFNDGNGKPLISFGDADAVEWFCEGRKANRKEILESIEGGMPALMALAAQEKGATEHLLATKKKFIERFVP